jgi:hypothetical protein
MAHYILTYIGGNHPKTPEVGQKHFAKYKEWLGSLGDAAVSPANPLKNTRTVNSDGSVTNGSTSNMSGYTIVEAEACPFLEIEGSLEVSELMQMSV